jgi:hypothetical protein
VHPFCNLQSWARTHAVLVIGLYDLLDPTTYLMERRLDIAKILLKVALNTINSNSNSNYMG